MWIKSDAPKATKLSTASKGFCYPTTQRQCGDKEGEAIVLIYRNPYLVVAKLKVGLEVKKKQ